MKRGHRGATKDYSDIFLVAILIGIVVIVLSLVMAIAHSTPQYREISSVIIKDSDQRNVLRDESPLRDGSPVLRN